MEERRKRAALRAHFETLKLDLVGRLAPVTAHLSAAEREALAADMTRLRLRHELRGMPRTPRERPDGTV